ncbi:MAG: RNA polymerase-binding protein DksA [Candidatus Tectomicrobia bacterium]|uniref:RNA polymerase-binding protein DksA n=1 Tax=Tectimicrobiota bacterium TaxID=2528274 RepID=A0A932GMA2_UNCTE|nr:RNA polymerase-binding protein DksA [Candidatus Tectomicrobia bacterium]
MDETTITFFRDLLLKKKQGLQNGSLQEGIQVVKEDLPDTVDRSALESDRNFVLRLKDRERKLLKKIDEALERIESGEFGTCDACGEEIGVERLKVRPEATLCIACKEEQERREKLQPS